MYALTFSIIFAILATGLDANPVGLKAVSSSQRVLSADEMLFFTSDGRVETIKRINYREHTEGVAVATNIQHNYNFTTDFDGNTAPKIEKRCAVHKVWTLKPTERYVDWDIPMTEVVQAPPDSSVDLAVTEGFSMGNSLSVTTASTIEIVESFFSQSLGINHSKQWTLTYSTGYKFKLPPGKFGAVVINPMTTRHSGYLDIGCVGRAKRTEFSGESYESKSYSDNTWFEGLIGLCIGDTYPLHKCFGEGIL